MRNCKKLQWREIWSKYTLKLKWISTPTFTACFNDAKKFDFFLAKKGEESFMMTQLHPNQTYAPRRPNSFHFVGKGKRFGGSGTVLAIYLFNYYLNLLQFLLGTDHLLIRTWCHELNIFIEEFSISKTVSKPIKWTYQLFLYLLSFFLLHPYPSLWLNPLFYSYFFLLKVFFFLWKEIMFVLHSTKNWQRNFHFPSNLFSISEVNGEVIKSLLLLDVYLELSGAYLPPDYWGMNLIDPATFTVVAPGIYLLKVNNRNTRTRCEICLKLTIKISERRQWRRSGIFIVNFEHISHLVLVFLLLALNM